MAWSTIYSFLAAMIAISGAAASGTPVLAARASTSSIVPVTISGNAFYRGDQRFYIRGVDYAPGGGIGTGADPLENGANCTRDIPYFTDLGINTIRVYTIDNSKDHSECMNALADAGIYVALDIDNSDYSLNRDNIEPSYNSVYLQSVFATIDAFANFDNTLLFISGNEIINDPSNTHDAPYVKASNRDMKQYIGSMGYRKIPVGYSAADVDQNQLSMAQFMACGSPDATGDFYGINDYQWCGSQSSFEISGWNKKVEEYTNYGLPLFLSEFGCITNDRNFTEIASLYSDMTGVFSGGLVYEYSEEGNGYGLVDISSTGKVTTNPDYDSLKKAYANAPNPPGNGGATSSSASVSCPTSDANWDVGSTLLPAIPEAAEKFMSQGAGPGPGFNGGSQDAGNSDTESKSSASPGSGSVTSTVSHIPSATSTPSGKKKSAAVQSQPLDRTLLSLYSVVVMVYLVEWLYYDWSPSQLFYSSFNAL